jgi:MFS family permease
MGATVAMQLGIPALSRRVGIVPLLVSGALLMGLPSFAYLGNPGAATVLIASALRGAGFGLVSIVATAVVIQLASVSRRTRAIGRFGLVTGMIAALAPALGVRLFDGGWADALFIGAGTVPLVGIALFPYAYLRTLRFALRAPRVLPLLKVGELARPTIVFALAAVGYGAVVSYLPTSFAGKAAAMLLLFGIVQAVMRGMAGRASAAFIQQIGLRIATGTALVGTVILWWASMRSNVLLAYGGLTCLGLGLGTLTTASLAALAVRGTDHTQIGPAVLWNVAFDAGIAAGGLIFSLAARIGSASSVYVLCAALLVLAFIVAVQDGRRPRLNVS